MARPGAASRQSSPRRRGPILRLGAMLLQAPVKIARARRMGPRLRGDDAVRAAMLGLALLAMLLPTSTAHAQKVDFTGQKIALAIATPAGGGYDLYGRLVGRYLGSYLPGNPIFVPQNMPGAGSLIAA